MSTKRTILANLNAAELRTALDDHELEVDDRRVKEQLIDALALPRKARIDEILQALKRDRLKDLCRALGLNDSGRAKAEIVARIIRELSRPERGGKIPPKEPPPAAAENRPRRKDECEHRTPLDRELQLGSCRSIERDRSVNTQAHEWRRGPESAPCGYSSRGRVSAKFRCRAIVRGSQNAVFIAGQAELAHGCLMALRRSERIQPFSLHGVGGHALTDVVQDTKGCTERRRHPAPQKVGTSAMPRARPERDHRNRVRT